MKGLQVLNCSEAGTKGMMSIVLTGLSGLYNVRLFVVRGFNSIYMQRRICCFLLCLLVMNVSFSQLLELDRNFQVDKILSLPMGNNEFIVSVCSSYPSGIQSIYVIKRSKDSLLVTAYVKGVNNEIEEVISISVNDDTMFVKEVENFYSEVKQNHSYKSYSKEVLTGGYFFLTFYEENKLQVFYNKEASQNQRAMINYVFKRLGGFSITPFGGRNPRKKYLRIGSWNELLKYLKIGSVDSVSK